MNIKDIDVNKRLNLGLEEDEDPDRYSPELKEYHLTIWGKRFKDLKSLTLEDDYINRMKLVGEGFNIVFTPDSITNGYVKSHRRYKDKIHNESYIESERVEDYSKENIEVKETLDKYVETDYKIGSSIIFPVEINGEKIKWTLNIARGILFRIHDRIDLTLECIRRYYQEPDAYNPLLSSIRRNALFFNLFSGFEEYIDFFFLNDLVNENYRVKPLFGELGFDTPFPTTPEEYRTYMENTNKFIEKRNGTIDKWIKSQK